MNWYRTAQYSNVAYIMDNGSTIPFSSATHTESLAVYLRSNNIKEDTGKFFQEYTSNFFQEHKLIRVWIQSNKFLGFDIVFNPTSSQKTTMTKMIENLFMNGEEKQECSFVFMTRKHETLSHKEFYDLESSLYYLAKI
jgi:hypothetical protein